MDKAQPGESRPQCRTCRGEKVITVKTHRGGAVVGEAKAECPACRGTGRAGYIKK